LPDAEYHFLLGRFIDSATLERASAIAVRWGVHPHEVLIANGWLDAEDYYRALAESCGTPFRPELLPADVAPIAKTSPRQCLASGLLKERRFTRSFIFAGDRLRPNALREMLARLKPHAFVLASPHAVRGAICRHFAATFARHAVDGLAARHPDKSARARPALWQRLCFMLGVTAILAVVALAPIKTIWALTLALALLFVPLIAFRLVPPTGSCAREQADSASCSRGSPTTSSPSTPSWCRSTARRICCRLSSRH